MGQKAVFIDRDGTINENIGYIDHPDKFHMYPGIAEGIKQLNDLDFDIIIITNQSAIARNLINEEELSIIHQKMKKELEKTGAKIDKIYYCPHHPDQKCNCRKPNTGMFEQAISENDINVHTSYVIGDRMLDIEAGHKMGLTTILIPENKALIDEEMKVSPISPNYYCDTFLSAVEWIAKRNQILKSDDKNKHLIF